jgi:hypothetical protein
LQQEHIHKIKFGAGVFALEHWAKNLKVCERENGGLFPSHEINLWICSKL